MKIFFLILFASLAAIAKPSVVIGESDRASITGGGGCGDNFYQNIEGYKTELVGFKPNNRLQFCDVRIQSRAENLMTAFLQLGERYKKCYIVSVDEGAKIITITKGDAAIYVQSQHVETSTYVVEGSDPLTFETNNEAKSRYFCPYNLSVAPAWAKKLFQQQEIAP